MLKREGVSWISVSVVLTPTRSFLYDDDDDDAADDNADDDDVNDEE